jgi:hypothetical protein
VTVDLSAFLEPNLRIEALAHALDGLTHEGRLHAIRSWNSKTQARLFDALANNVHPFTRAHFAPPESGALRECIHEGKNSLPVFTQFQKRFARTESGELFGYNHGITMALTGPGYFVVRDGDRPNELAIDYTIRPQTQLQGWPALAANTSGIRSLVFGEMVDHMRRLSTHIAVGRAAKTNKMMDNWFVLCRTAAP